MRFNKEEDPDMYWTCMWANISLDHDNYTASIISDCGDYTYTWGASKNESFRNLLSRINEDYLLDKISKCNVFNLERSKQETIERIKSYYEDADEDTKRDEQINSIREIEFFGEEGFYIEADSIVENSDLIEIVREYPRGAITICEVFKRYLQPLLISSLEEA